MSSRPLVREEVDFLRSVADKVAVAIYIIRDGRFVFVNKNFAEALGYTTDEILAFDSVTRILADDQHEVIEEVRRRNTARDASDVRFCTKVKDARGEIQYVEVRGSELDVAGERLLVGIAVNVTPYVKSGRMTRDREEYFRALTENVSDIVAILDGTGVLRYISPAVERCLGYRAADLLGSVAFACVHPDDRRRFAEGLEQLVRGDVFGPAEYRFQHANRSWRVLEVVGTNLLHDGRIDGLVVRLRDITERRRLEQELAQLHRLTSLGRLSAQVAHEFNNVLMGIQPAVDVMRRRMADQPELLPLLEAINVSISRGKRITTDVLKFGRPAQLTSTPVRPADLLSKVVDELRPMLNENVRVTLALSDTPLMLADPAQLSQVFMNLALNARDAMPSGGTLTIRASLAHGSESGSPQPFIHFAVSDTGTGIPDEDLSWIFEPLFTTKKTGTGLGLSVVYQIVTLHGGRISVESQRGKGTTFDILIPAMAAGETPADEAEAVEPSRPECQRILIVDDEELVALGLRVSLEGHGFDVEVVGTGAEVMAAIDRFKPDVVVLDLSLPDADGREVYAEISSRFAVPVLFSSGHAAEWEIGKLLTAPGTGFLMKPYSTDELLATIRTLVASSEARR